MAQFRLLILVLDKSSKVWYNTDTNQEGEINMKKIKNRTIRRILRTIANWDNCPTDCKRNWSADLFNYAMYFAVGYIVLLVFSFFVLKFM